MSDTLREEIENAVSNIVKLPVVRQYVFPTAGESSFRAHGSGKCAVAVYNRVKNNTVPPKPMPVGSNQKVVPFLTYVHRVRKDATLQRALQDRFR